MKLQYKILYNPIYFDNLKITHDRGHILEENHYYPYGLKIAPIRSQALTAPQEGIVKNNYQYQGAYSEFDDELSWNSFYLRDYNPQLGRWIQQDPYQQFATPYVGMGGDPVNNVDPSGGDLFDLFPNGTGSFLGDQLATAFEGAVTGIAAGAILHTASGKDFSSNDALKWGLAGAGGALLADDVPWRTVGGALINAGNWVGSNIFGASWINQNISDGLTAMFIRTDLDLDGGRFTYREDDEGSDFLINASPRIRKNSPRQYNNNLYYLSKTSEVKNKRLNENDPERYYDPITDPFIVLNPPLKKLHLEKGNWVKVTNFKNHISIDALIVDSGPMGDDYNGSLEISPAAFDRLKVHYDFKVPKYYNHTTGKPYVCPKYTSASENENLQVKKKNR